MRRSDLTLIVTAILCVLGLGLGLVWIQSIPVPAPTQEDEDFGTVQIYDVLPDGTLEPEATGTALAVWNDFVRVATVEFAASVITEYRVGDAPESDTLAYVYQDSDPELWTLAVNLATADDTELLIATLIHEYGHILTLGVAEVDPPVADCPTLSLDEGCAMPESIIQTFSEQFWKPYGDEAPATGNSDEEVAFDFYLEHDEDFVSDYAATNVVEDVAETFMTFVLEDKPTDTSPVARKILFFWDYPELVAERDRIRTEFATELGFSN